MTSKIDERLKTLGISLPEVTAPLANYVPFTISGNTLYISGQLPGSGPQLVKGILGRDLDVMQGQAAAKLCAIVIIAQAKAALGGDLDRVTRCLRLGGFVASTPEFTDHPKVVNGASDFIVTVFEDKGKHARAAVGVAALPLGAAVEVDAIFEIK